MADPFPVLGAGRRAGRAAGALLGTIECFITPTAFLVGTNGKLPAFDAPGLFGSLEHLARVIHEKDYRDHIEVIAIESDVRIIGAIFNSPFAVLSKTPAPKHPSNTAQAG